MVEEGIENDTEDGATLVDQSQGDADKRKAVDKIGRAVWLRRLALNVGQSSQRTDWVDAKRRLVSQGWTRPGRVRLFADAIKYEF